jgi:hypothetical protein
VRPEDIIADFLSKFDPARRSAEDGARDLLAVLAREQMGVRECIVSDCPLCGGGDWEE